MTPLMGIGIVNLVLQGAIMILLYRLARQLRAMRERDEATLKRLSPPDPPTKE